MAQLGTYAYSLLQRILNTKIHGRLSNLNSGSDTNIERDLINSAVRIGISDIDFKGNIRKTTLTPNLMDNQWDYVLPTDADNIIDFAPQNTDSRGEFETFDFVPPEEFDRRKKVEEGIYTVVNDNLSRTLRVSSNVEDYTLKLSTMEDTVWGTFDSVSVNDSDVKIDNDDYIEGNGSVRFQTDTSDTSDSTVGIQTTLDAVDISSYLARGSAFVDAKLTTYDTGIHQVSIRIGSDSDNYYQVNDSTQNDCSAFQTGWNKIRWDLQNKTTVGTPSDTAIDYVALFWSRDTTSTALLHLNDTDWGFDNLQLKRGKYYNISYYTRNVWQDTTLAVVENSANDSHTLMVANDELEVIMAKAAELASQTLRDYEDVGYFREEYEKLKNAYLMVNPSQNKTLVSNRYNFINSYDCVSDS
jgi:hypothetical protein